MTDDRQTKNAASEGTSGSHCSTCRWWVLDKNDRYDTLISPADPVTHEQEDTEDAIAAKWGHAVRRCRCPKISFYQRPDRDGATVCDGSEYMADLLTGPDFGCIHHDANDRLDGQEGSEERAE